MTIANVREKCKAWAAKIPRDALVLSVLLLASLASFGLGYLAGQESGQGSISVEMPTSSASGAFVASISGTRYYPVSCAGAARISDTNKVYFSSAADAEAAGYQRASGCGN